MYLAHQAVHNGISPQALKAPQEYLDRFKFIAHDGRRRYAGNICQQDNILKMLRARQFRYPTFPHTTQDYQVQVSRGLGCFQKCICCNAVELLLLRLQEQTLCAGTIFACFKVWAGNISKTVDMINAFVWPFTIYLLWSFPHYTASRNILSPRNPGWQLGHFNTIYL